MVEQASASREQRSVKSVTVGGVGGGHASNLVIQQIFVECLRQAGPCEECQNLCPGLVFTLNMVATSKPLITFYTVCASGYILVCVCGHVHTYVCVCLC